MAEFWNGLTGAERLYIIVILSIIPVLLFGIIASLSVHMTFKRYEQISSQAGVSASEVARSVLDRNGLEHVGIQRTPGKLTDHYDPRSDTVSLSDSVYSSYSMAAIGVACHEAGHAIQHNKNYAFAKLRSALVPVVNISNKIFFPILIVGMILGLFVSDTPIGNVIVFLAVGMFGFSTLFALVTLPTEFDASRRALNSLKEDGRYSRTEVAQAGKVLKAAAMTYVAAFLMSLIQFLRFLAILLMHMSSGKKKR